MNVGKELQKILKEKGMNQKDICDLTGIPASAMSQYMSGKSTPQEGRRKILEEVLQLPAGYLDPEKTEDGTIKRISVEEAAHVMQIGTETLKAEMRAGKCLPWGRAIETGKDSFVYWVNSITFMKEMGLA